LTTSYALAGPGSTADLVPEATEGEQRLAELSLGRTPPIFPVTVTVYDGPAETFDDPIELASTIENLNDSEPYAARDAAGRRVRLIIDELQLLLGVLVPDSFIQGDLSIAIEATAGARSRYMEVDPDGNCYRSLLVDGRKVVECQPRTWDTQVESVSGASPADLSWQHFDAEWVACRQRRRSAASRVAAFVASGWVERQRFV